MAHYKNSTLSAKKTQLDIFSNLVLIGTKRQKGKKGNFYTLREYVDTETGEIITKYK